MGAMTLDSERSRSAPLCSSLVYRQLQSSPALNETEGTVMEHTLRFLRLYTGRVFIFKLLRLPVCLQHAVDHQPRGWVPPSTLRYPWSRPSGGFWGGCTRTQRWAKWVAKDGHFQWFWLVTLRKYLTFLHLVGPLKSIFIIKVFSDEKTSLRTTWVL